MDMKWMGAVLPGRSSRTCQPSGMPVAWPAGVVRVLPRLGRLLGVLVLCWAAAGMAAASSAAVRIDSAHCALSWNVSRVNGRRRARQPVSYPPRPRHAIIGMSGG